MNTESFSMARRGILGGVIASLATPFLNQKARASLNRTTISDYENRLPIYARVRGNGIDGPKALWWISGIIYGKQYGEMAEPLIRMTGVSLNQLVAREGGGVFQTMEEAGYFTDLETGSIIDAWPNPYTGENTTPEAYKMEANHGINADGLVERPNARMSMDVSGGIGPVEVSGDRLWVQENYSARVTLLGPSLAGRDDEQETGKTRVVDSLATFEARVDDVLGPDGSFVPATLAYQETDPWFPWMKMGDRPGLQIWQLKGRKMADPEELPLELKDRLRSDYPGFV